MARRFAEAWPDQAMDMTRPACRHFRIRIVHSVAAAGEPVVRRRSTLIPAATPKQTARTEAGSGTGANRSVRLVPSEMSEKLAEEANNAGSKLVGWKFTAPRSKLPLAPEEIR